MLKPKQKNKKRRLYHFDDMINDFDFYDISHGIVETDEGRYTGDLYVLDKPDENRLKEIIEKYDNTYIVRRYYRYAPELKDICLFIAK